MTNSPARTAKATKPHNQPLEGLYAIAAGVGLLGVVILAIGIASGTIMATTLGSTAVGVAFVAWILALAASAIITELRRQK